MSRKNKWSFIENKEAREALINGSDLLKKCAKTYYVGYKNRFDEIVEPYRYICEGISGVKGTKIPLYIAPELIQSFRKEAQNRCSEEHARLKAVFETWELLLTWTVIFCHVPEDKIKKVKKQVLEDLSKMQRAIWKEFYAVDSPFNFNQIK